MNVELTEVESRICDLFDKCATYLREEKGINTSCRIAGGWVRDKLLGKESDDIDVALSGMMGVAFAEHLSEFAKTQGIQTGTVGKIALNPDQSKHLETATLKVFGLDIDLVNLRSEEYASDSRIPTEVTFGTPLQDALRRDITINAMFFNVHTRSVEDFTEKGLDDLRNGIIRTPLPPRETFLDDPLRVLRCLRFASRFGFRIVPEVQQAMRDPVIQRALVQKVTRERAGTEVGKMMKGRDPLHSIALINDLSLYDAIFSVFPEEARKTLSNRPAPAIASLASAAVLQSLLNEQDSSLEPVHPTLLFAVREDPSCKGRLFLASALSPFIGITYVDIKKKTLPAVSLALWESLRLGTQNHFSDGVPALFAASEILSKPYLNRFRGKIQRVAIGLLLREKCVHNPNTGSHWTSSLLFSLVQDLVPHYNLTGKSLDGPPYYNLTSKAFDAYEANEVIQLYNTFVNRIEELELTNVVDAKPLLDGREIVKTLGAKPGPWTGQVLAKVMEWQLQNPRGSKEECVVWLKGEHKAGNFSVTQESSEPATKKARKR